MAKNSKNLSDNSTSTHSLSATPVKQANSASAEASVPVVTVLGHVDHGKTTLLDAIRKTNVASREHGGITQKIGASQVEILHEGKERKVTFIDTPGHEAFMQMRGRGAKVADIGLLIISSVDGIMPQTKESIKILKTSNIPYIVVLTKSDVADKNVEKVKGQLLKEEVMLESQGGDVPVIEVSAKTNQNIKELLDLILLVSDMHPVEISEIFKGVVIESRLDPKAGPRATVVIKSGKLALRDEIVSGEVVGRVRTLINDKAEQLKEANTGDAIEVLGFEKVPAVGSIVYKKGQEVKAEEEAKSSGEAFREGSENLLRVVIVADSYGSLEAIVNAVEEKINIVSKKTGEITPADVMFAKSTGAIILGFNAKISPAIEKQSREEKVLIRNYPLIYEMISEIEDFLEGKRLSLEEKIFGRAKILASFPFDKQKVIGIAVLEGRVAKGDRIRIERDNVSVGEGMIASVRQGKDQISKVETGSEAGVLLANDLDFQVGDVLICHG